MAAGTQTGVLTEVSSFPACQAGYSGDPANGVVCTACENGYYAEANTTTSCSYCGNNTSTGGPANGTSIDKCGEF